MKHQIVMYSGGAASWCAAERVVERFGPGNTTLLFADTMMEDEDLYRFMDEGAEALGIEVTRIADGRTPWEVFHDVRFLGNTRADPCSRILKRELIKKWVRERFEPHAACLVMGMDWTEEHRSVRSARYWEPYEINSPLLEAPYLTKTDMLNRIRDAGVEPPRLYRYGFAHNNCGGFCIKAGIGQFAKLLEVMPDRYREHEAEEERLRSALGKEVSILRDRRGGPTKPRTLQEWREEIETQGCGQIDLFDLGGCGCMTPPDEEE